MKKILAIFAFALVLVFPAIAQAPSLKCPIHNVPAFYTGKQKTVGNYPNGNTTYYEYCDNGNSSGHCWWSDGKL